MKIGVDQGLRGYPRSGLTSEGLQGGPGRHVSTAIIRLPKRPSSIPCNAHLDGVTHLDESLIVHVQQLIKLDTTVMVLPEGSGCLLGSGFLAGGNVGLLKG